MRKISNEVQADTNNFFGFATAFFSQFIDRIHDDYFKMRILPEFNYIVESSTQLLKTCGFDKLSDRGQMYMMACRNTIIYTKADSLNEPVIYRFRDKKYK